MASFNKVILLGNLTRDPEMKYLPSNTPVVEFGMAVNRKFKDGQGQDREEVMFIDCAAFGKPAEIINQYCHKGNLLFVEGRLRFEQWESEGQKRSKHRVAIENFQLMPNGQRDSDTAPPARTTTRAARPSAADRPDAQEQFGDDDPNSIPF